MLMNIRWFVHIERLYERRITKNMEEANKQYLQLVCVYNCGCMNVNESKGGSKDCIR